MIEIGACRPAAGRRQDARLPDGFAIPPRNNTLLPPLIALAYAPPQCLPAFDAAQLFLGTPLAGPHTAKGAYLVLCRCHLTGSPPKWTMFDVKANDDAHCARRLLRARVAPFRATPMMQARAAQRDEVSQKITPLPPGAVPSQGAVACIATRRLTGRAFSVGSAMVMAAI